MIANISIVVENIYARNADHIIESISNKRGCENELPKVRERDD